MYYFVHYINILMTTSLTIFQRFKNIELKAELVRFVATRVVWRTSVPCPDFII